MNDNKIELILQLLVLLLQQSSFSGHLLIVLQNK
jgi:hypothetical protein